MTVPLDTNDGDCKKSGKLYWGGSVEGIDCGDEVATWLSWNIDRPGLRLIRCTGRKPAEVNNYGKLTWIFFFFFKNVIFTHILFTIPNLTVGADPSLSTWISIFYRYMHTYLALAAQNRNSSLPSSGVVYYRYWFGLMATIDISKYLTSSQTFAHSK